MKKYIFFLTCILYFSSCSSVCKKTVGRELLEINKEDLACSCNNLKRDTLLSQKVARLEKGTSRYLVGKVLINKNNKGIYQYVKTGSGIRGNMFFYYNGSDVRLLSKEDLKYYADSVRLLGVDDRKISKMMPVIEKSISKPPVNTTDSF